MPLTVKWGRERIHIDLPPPQAPLSALRQALADYTHIPPDGFKLIHAGAIMKDDNAPLSAYRLHPNSTIALIPVAEPPQQPHQQRTPAPAPKSEQTIISLIHSELEKVRAELTPDVQAFLSSRGATQKQDEKEHARLGELLLQALLRLDGIMPSHEWEDARRERKEAVKEVQGLLDRLDAARSS